MPLRSRKDVAANIAAECSQGVAPLPRLGFADFAVLVHIADIVVFADFAGSVDIAECADLWSY